MLKLSCNCAECRYTGCRYAECHGAGIGASLKKFLLHS